MELHRARFTTSSMWAGGEARRQRACQTRVLLDEPRFFLRLVLDAPSARNICSTPSPYTHLSVCVWGAPTPPHLARGKSYPAYKWLP